MFRILFVCTGNTCRSPMAEAILKNKNIPGLEVKSAGIFAINGQEASKHAQTVLAEKEIPSSHLSSQLTKETIDWATHVFAMTTSHKQSILSFFPEAKEKTYTLKEFVGEKEQLDVLDPFGGTIETYRATYEELKGLIDTLLKKLKIDSK